MGYVYTELYVKVRSTSRSVLALLDTLVCPAEPTLVPSPASRPILPPTQRLKPNSDRESERAKVSPKPQILFILDRRLN